MLTKPVKDSIYAVNSYPIFGVFVENRLIINTTMYLSIEYAYSNIFYDYIRRSGKAYTQICSLALTLCAYGPA